MTLQSRQSIPSAFGPFARRAAIPAGCARALTGAALVVAALAVPTGAAEAQQGRQRQIEAMRVDQGPVVDGVLDDAVWQDAPVIREFIQQEPNEGAPATERTEVRVLYDGVRLFLGVHAFDSSPGGVIATEMRRDASRILEEDNFQVIIDTFMDSRTAYRFVVSPQGAQLDEQIFDEGGRDRRGSTSAVNRDWDGVWSVATSRTADGWTAEIEIPVVTMRFPDRDPQSWGINFMRNISRKNEQAFWAPIPKQFDITRVSLAGTLVGLTSLDRGRDIRIKPYVSGGGRRQLLRGVQDNSVARDAGVDVKYGIMPGVNLDVTILTDFAQAEVDNEQVNLTRFALLYPEKREFFLENAGQFVVGTTNSQGQIADLFFSRRIGISDSRAQVPILGGARLTGKVGRHNLAMMNIQTDEMGAQPGENFMVARYSQDLFERSQVGALFINKRANSGGHFNRTYAADMTVSPTAAITIDGFLAATSSPGVTDQQYAGHIRAGWLDRTWRIYTEYTDLGNNFNPEVGFVPRVGIQRSKLHFEMNPRPGRYGIRMMEPMWNVEYYTDQTGRLVSRQYHYMVRTLFDAGSSINVMYNRYFERLDRPFRVTSSISIAPGDYEFTDLILSYSSNPTRRFFYGINYGPQTFYDGDRTNSSVRAGVRVNEQFSTSARLSRNDVNLPGGSFTADIGSLQFDFSPTPQVSLRSISQFNSLTDQWSTSGRLRYMYRPGSDIFIVYDEVRRDDALPTSPFLEQYRDRQLIVKMTYLLSM
jgi:hypothetical protein